MYYLWLNCTFKLIFSQRPTERDWNRFHMLAPRIKTLCHNEVEGPGRAVVQELEATNPEPLLPLLPNIRELSWRSAVSDPLLPLMGSSLRQIAFETDGSDDKPPASIFSRIPVLCPDLTCIRIGCLCYASTQEKLEDLAETLQQLRALKSATIPLISCPQINRLLFALSVLPHLEAVEFGCPNDTLENWTPFGNSGDPFVSLTSLKFEAYSGIPGVVPFLRDLEKRGSNLNRFEIDCGGGDPAGVLQALGGHSDLRHVHIHDKDALVPLSSQLLAPILVYLALEHLDVSVAGPFEMSDEDMITLTSSLPKLRNLRLESFRSHVPTLTINALGIIAASCHLIQTIRILPLDLSNPNPSPAFQPSGTLAQSTSAHRV